MYHSMDEIVAMDTGTFVKHWDDGTIVDSCMIELGAMKRSAAEEATMFNL